MPGGGMHVSEEDGMNPWIVLISVVALTVVVATAVGIATFVYYRRPWRLRCPRDGASAKLQVNAGAATCDAAFGVGGPYVERCSQRAPGEVCDEACLALPATAHRAVGSRDVPLPVDGSPVVLVPLDGTPGSETALRIARPLARARGARLRLLRVMPPAEPVQAGGHRLIAYVDQEAARVTDEARDYLRALRRVLTNFDIEDVVRFGAPAKEILREAEAPDVAVIVMAAHDSGWLRRLARRSVTDRVERAAWVPVVRAPYAAGV